MSFIRKKKGKSKFGVRAKRLQNKMYRLFRSVGFPEFGSRQIAIQLGVKKFERPCDVVLVSNGGRAAIEFKCEGVVFKAVAGEIDYIGSASLERLKQSAHEGVTTR